MSPWSMYGAKPHCSSLWVSRSRYLAHAGYCGGVRASCTAFRASFVSMLVAAVKSVVDDSVLSPRASRLDILAGALLLCPTSSLLDNIVYQNHNCDWLLVSALHLCHALTLRLLLVLDRLRACLSTTRRIWAAAATTSLMPAVRSSGACSGGMSMWPASCLCVCTWDTLVASGGAGKTCIEMVFLCPLTQSRHERASTRELDLMRDCTSTRH